MMNQTCIVVTNPMIAANRSSEVTLSKFLRVLKPSYSRIIVIGGNLRVEQDLNDVELISFDIIRSASRFKRMLDILWVQCRMYRELLTLVRKGTPVFFWIADKMFLPYLAAKQKAGRLYYFIYGNMAKEGQAGFFARLSAILLRYMAEHADHLCMESLSVCKEWPGLRGNAPRVLHLYVDEIEMNPLGKREKVLGMICRLTEGKHVLECISAMQSLHEDYPHWRLEIIGSGRQQEECEALIRELEAEEYISLLGWVEHEQIVHCSRMWSWLLFPTDTEGLPNSLLEMMGRGIPALASPVGGIRDLVQNEVNGFYLSDTTPEEIARGIRHIFSLDEKAYESCCRSAYVRIASGYTLTGAAENAKEELQR